MSEYQDPQEKRISSKVIAKRFNKLLETQDDTFIPHDKNLISTLINRKFIIDIKNTCHMKSYDYYLITSLIIIKNDIPNEQYFLKTLIYPFFEYSEIYVNTILSEVNFQIYKISKSNHIVRHYEDYITMYHKNIECESLKYVVYFHISDLRYLKYHTQEQLTKTSEYNNHDALWINHLFTYFPHTIEFKL